LDLGNHPLAYGCAGPPYPYDYQTNTWDGSYQQLNTSTYYDAQKHAFMQNGTAGWFQWNWVEHSSALQSSRPFLCVRQT
jgi:hypothetical protein